MADFKTLWFPDETFAQYLKRINAEQVRTDVFLLDDFVKLRAGQILEVCGPTASCKTELLIQLAVGTLQSRFDHVIFLDLDGKMDPLRLVQVADLRSKASICQQGQGAQTGSASFESILERFHLIRCNSSIHFLRELANVERFLRSVADASASRCRLILIDNVGAFHWHDRAGGHAPLSLPSTMPPELHEETATFFSNHGDSTFEKQVQHTAALLIKRIAVEQRLAVVATKNTAVTMRSGMEGQMLSANEFLPSPWQEVVTKRLLLHAVEQSDASLQHVAQWQWQGSQATPCIPFSVSKDAIMRV